MVNNLKKSDSHHLKSYSPYSGREETCLAEGESGALYPGVRVENISFPLSISAVQGAVCSCIANNDSPVRIFQQPPHSELLSFWISEFSLELVNHMPDHTSVYNPVMTEPDDIPSALKKLSRLAVTPNSGFPVAALLKTDKGYIPGVNVEVSSWGLGLCAERVAIFRAVTSGLSNFEEISVYAPRGDFNSPCGACRQVLNEFMPEKQAELLHGDGSLSTHFIKHLLPYGFTSESLKK